MVSSGATSHTSNPLSPQFNLKTGRPHVNWRLQSTNVYLRKYSCQPIILNEKNPNVQSIEDEEAVEEAGWARVPFGLALNGSVAIVVVVVVLGIKCRRCGPIKTGHSWIEAFLKVVISTNTKVEDSNHRPWRAAEQREECRGRGWWFESTFASRRWIVLHVLQARFHNT